jgi:hypothetical protein
MITIIMAGLGRDSLATQVFRQIARRLDMALAEDALASAGVTKGSFPVGVGGTKVVSLVISEGHQSVLGRYPGSLVVDVPEQEVAVADAKLYESTGHSFVMLVDEAVHDELARVVEGSSVSAVIGTRGDAEDALAAIRFLSRQVAEGSRGRAFTIAEVLASVPPAIE